MKDLAELIFDTLDDVVSKFIYYDRKEDEDLPVGAIEQAIKDGVLTVDEIVERFRTTLTEGL
jgi:hypothetical protein